MSTENLSRRGQELIDRTLNAQQPAENLTTRLMERRAVPDPSGFRSIDMNDNRLRELLASRIESVQDRMTELSQAIHMRPRPGESPMAQHFRESSKGMAMRSLENTVEVSRDPMELDYAAQMFLEQRAAMLKLAKNPYISEDTIIRVATCSMYRDDPQIARAFAGNPGITPKAARVLMENEGNKRRHFVMHELAVNLGKQARLPSNAHAAECAALCRDITSVSVVDTPLAPAIAGVTDPEHIRKLYSLHASRMPLERNMERSVYHAIAQNPDTPDDVIKAMSQKAPLAASFGKDAALSHDTISRRMAEMELRTQTASISNDAPSMSR